MMILGIGYVQTRSVGTGCVLYRWEQQMLTANRGIQIEMLGEN